MNQYAKEAMKRLASGFYREDKNIAKAKIKNDGNYTDKDDEEYGRAKRVLLSPDGDKALSILAEPDEMAPLDDAGKERYMMNLSEKLEEWKRRLQSEREYNLVEDAISL